MIGRFHSGADYLCGISAQVPDAMRGDVTVRLYEDGQEAPLRESTRASRPNDDPWRVFSFDPVAASAEKTYRVCCQSPAGETPIEAKPLHSPLLSRLFDPWLSQLGQPLPPVPARLERYLDRHVLECLRMKRHFFLRLAHLADAVGRIPDPLTDVLAIGVGAAYQEAFLAGRFPDLQIEATDIDQPPCEFPMPNLRFSRLDLTAPPRAAQCDLVSSIECLEHIEDPRRAFAHQVAMARPGRYVYVSVPFATRAEQADPDLCRAAWDLCGHYRPGFAFEDLEEMCAENGVDIVHASNMFYVDVIVPARQVLDRMSAGEFECAAEALARMMLLDLRERRATSFREAEGIRVLGRKR